MKKKIIAISLLIIMCFGCANKTIKNNNIYVIDMEGSKVEIPNKIERVACISQSATDLMIAFGLGEKIYGTYRSFMYNTWVPILYPYANNYKLYSYSVSAEELINDKIDLVLIQDTENIEALRKTNIPIIAVHQFTNDDEFDDEVYDIAEILKTIFPECKDKADYWINDVKKAIEDVRNNIKDSNEVVYYINGEKAKGLYYSDGGHSMISRVLHIAGVKLATEMYSVLNVHKVSDEEMINLNPDAILIGGAYQNILADELKNSSVWSTLDANKNNKVYQIPVCMVGIENVSAETSLMIKYAASLFSGYQFDINSEIKKCIKYYFNYDLSDRDVENMVKGLDNNGQNMIKR